MTETFLELSNVDYYIIPSTLTIPTYTCNLLFSVSPRGFLTETYICYIDLPTVIIHKVEVITIFFTYLLEYIQHRCMAV